MAFSLFRLLTNKNIQCQVCSHYCSLKSGQKGFCGVRLNDNGQLKALNYRQIVACHLDPVEKKPLFHFLPRTLTLSLAAVGCNFQCLNCQNWQISQAPRLSPDCFSLPETPPEKIIALAQENNCPSISYTYTEPTIFLETAWEIMELAQQEKIKNIWVTNGFFSHQTAKLIAPLLAAANIDLKFFSEKKYHQYCKGKLQPILDNIRYLYQKNIHLEITTLVIPSLVTHEDLKGIASFLASLDKNIPWHLTAFSPYLSWKLKELPPTSREELEKAALIAQKAGLKNVYLGNI